MYGDGNKKVHLRWNNKIPLKLSICIYKFLCGSPILFWSRSSNGHECNALAFSSMIVPRKWATYYVLSHLNTKWATYYVLMAKNIWDKKLRIQGIQVVNASRCFDWSYVLHNQYVLCNQNTLCVQQLTTKHLEIINKLVFFQVKVLWFLTIPSFLFYSSK